MLADKTINNEIKQSLDNEDRVSKKDSLFFEIYEE
jgi:hypothetical protein